MPTAVITLWSREPIYESPAKKSFYVNWEGDLIRADVSIDVDPNPFNAILPYSFVKKILINGTEVPWSGDPNDVISVDARPYLRKGANVLEIHHDVIPWPGIPTAWVYAYIMIESTGPVGGESAPPSGDGIPIPISGIPSWIWILGLILLILVILR
jgi:hypothetical protein